MRTTPVTFYSEGQRIDALWRTPDAGTGPFRAIVQGPGWLGLKDSKLYVRYHEALDREQALRAAFEQQRGATRTQNEAASSGCLCSEVL